MYMLFDIGHTLRKLRSYHDTPYPILSVYLGFSPDRKDGELLQCFYDTVSKSLRPEEIAIMTPNITYIEAFLKNYKNTNGYRGIAMFSGDNVLWEVATTEFMLPDLAKFGYSPYLEPIYHSLASYERYLVILADREKANFFTLYHGRVEKQAAISDPSVPQNVKANEERFYGRADKISRHIQDHLHRHLQLISQNVHDFVGTEEINGVLIGGHKEMLQQIKNHLPSLLKRRVLGTFVTELNLSLRDLVEKSKHAITECEKNVDFSASEKRFTFS